GVARHQMVSLIGEALRTLLGPNDRLLRWRGTSFVMFLNTAESIRELRLRLADAVAAMCKQHVEAGKKAAVLPLGVDWIVFPQSQCPSLDAVFAEVDSFLSA